MLRVVFYFTKQQSAIPVFTFMCFIQCYLKCPCLTFSSQKESCIHFTGTILSFFLILTQKSIGFQPAKRRRGSEMFPVSTDCSCCSFLSLQWRRDPLLTLRGSYRSQCSAAVCDLSAGKFTPVVFRGNVCDVSRLRRDCLVTCQGG